jgi:hypothetical protein
LITVLTFFFLVIVLSVLWYTASDYRLDLFLFGHCIVCPSLIYGFWLPFWPLSFWSLYCLSIDIRLLITVLTFFFLAIEYQRTDNTMTKKKKDKTVIRSRISKDKQYNDQKEKGQNGNQKPYIKGQTIQWPKR